MHIALYLKAIWFRNLQMNKGFKDIPSFFKHFYVNLKQISQWIVKVIRSMSCMRGIKQRKYRKEFYCTIHVKPVFNNILGSDEEMQRILHDKPDFTVVCKKMAHVQKKWHHVQKKWPMCKKNDTMCKKMTHVLQITIHKS